MMKRVASVLFVLCLVSSASVWADSSVTGITLSRAADDICIGDSLNVTAVIQGSDPVTNVKWRTKIKGCTPEVWRDWFDSGTSPVISTTLNAVCTFTIEVTVTFRRYPMGGNYTSVKTLDVTVGAPDSLRLSNPGILGVDQDPVAANAVGNLRVSYDIMFKGRGAYVKGPVQEFITHLAPIQGPPGEWTGPLDTFYSDPGCIIDYKGVLIGPPLTGPNGIDFFPAGHLFDNLDQSIRISLPVGCGGNEWFDLPPMFHFQMVKSDTPGKWKLILVE